MDLWIAFNKFTTITLVSYTVKSNGRNKKGIESKWIIDRIFCGSIFIMDNIIVAVVMVQVNYDIRSVILRLSRHNVYIFRLHSHSPTVALFH